MFRFPQAVLCAAILTAGTAAAVPTSDERDPPVPPSGFGRLFGAEMQNAIRNCSVTAQTSSQATVGFTNSFPHAMVSYIDTGGNRTAWSSLPSGATSYDCTTIGGCFHATAEVHIRGCHNAGCVGDPVVACSVNIGLPLNGPPDITWGGVETTQALPVGCVEGAATSFAVRLRYAGTTPGTGYPTIGGVAATERTAERVVNGTVTEATYVATAGWTAADITAGYWDFTVALDSSGTRDAPARIALGTYCLAAPTAQVVGSGSPPTLTPIAAGSSFVSGTELEVQSANSGMALTGQQLMHNTVASAFGRVAPAGGTGRGHAACLARNRDRARRADLYQPDAQPHGRRHRVRQRRHAPVLAGRPAIDGRSAVGHRLDGGAVDRHGRLSGIERGSWQSELSQFRSRRSGRHTGGGFLCG